MERRRKRESVTSRNLIGIQPTPKWKISQREGGAVNSDESALETLRGLLISKGEQRRKDLQELNVPEEQIVKKIGLMKKGRKSKYYKKVFYNLFLILGNSGLRISSLLKLIFSFLLKLLFKYFSLLKFTFS